ncbi:hypothetical protein Bbelb_143540 [Branchiostoma belcheri]|nr:hypothetical protein Bbelb_143540 [Branchiostoma belcheri]
MHATAHGQTWRADHTLTPCETVRVTCVDATPSPRYVCFVFSENVGKERHRRTSLARHSHGFAKCKSVVYTPRLAVSGRVHRGRTHTCVFRTVRAGHARRPYSHARVVNPQTARRKKFYNVKFYGVSACSQIRRIPYGGGTHRTHGCPTFAHVFALR